MPIWTAEAERDLLLQIIGYSAPTVPKETWEKIASNTGNGYTKRSCKDRYLMLRKTAAEIGNATDRATTDKTTDSPATPKTSGRKRKSTAKATNDDDDDHEEEEETPTKKSKGNVKAEDEE